MKKLMMAVAIVCAAVGVQAASISWTSNGKQLTDAAGVPLNTEAALANIVLVNLGQSINWANATKIPVGSLTEQTTMAIGTAATSSSKAGTVSGKVTFAYDSVDTSGNLINNGDYLALMVDDGKGNLSKLVYTSGDDKGKDVVATYQVSGLTSNKDAKTGAKINMTNNFAAAVPEPTSAMLLLLGMAGLALRRRRA